MFNDSAEIITVDGYGGGIEADDLCSLIEKFEYHAQDTDQNKTGDGGSSRHKHVVKKMRSLIKPEIILNKTFPSTECYTSVSYGGQSGLFEGNGALEDSVSLPCYTEEVVLSAPAVTTDSGLIVADDVAEFVDVENTVECINDPKVVFSDHGYCLIPEEDKRTQKGSIDHEEYENDVDVLSYDQQADMQVTSDSIYLNEIPAYSRFSKGVDLRKSPDFSASQSTYVSCSFHGVHSKSICSKTYKNRKPVKKKSKKRHSHKRRYSSSDSVFSESSSSNESSSDDCKEKRGRRLYKSRNHLVKTDKSHEKAMDERRVVYVGGISSNFTTFDLRQLFDRYGEIENSSVHFRNHGDNYGFITFTSAEHASSAIEGGRRVFGDKYTLCYGGRRKFCKTDYADLDGCTAVKEEFLYSHLKSVDDFESLLHATIKSSKN